MSESLSIHQISTAPIPFGVSIKWKWPETSHWFSQLELQYLLSDGRLVKEFISWPVTVKHISGLKAGERLQVRLRLLPLKAAAREWLASDWMDGVSSTDTSDIIESIEHSIKKEGWCISGSGSASFNGVTIHGGLNVNEGKTVYNARIGVGINNTKMKISLSDEMKSAVIDAVRESKQFVENEVVNTESAKAEPKDAPAMMAAGYLSVVDGTETDIEKETLSAVLTNALHGGPEDRFMDTAIQLAKAVKAAFNELNTEDATAN